MCLTKLLTAFIDEFFHLNPISQMGLIVTRNKSAEFCVNRNRGHQVTNNKAKRSDLIKD